MGIGGHLMCVQIAQHPKKEHFPLDFTENTLPTKSTGKNALWFELCVGKIPLKSLAVSAHWKQGLIMRDATI